MALPRGRQLLDQRFAAMEHAILQKADIASVYNKQTIDGMLVEINTWKADTASVYNRQAIDGMFAQINTEKPHIESVHNNQEMGERMKQMHIKIDAINPFINSDDHIAKINAQKEHRRLETR